MIHTINPHPKDIHEGTLNALLMIRNEITMAEAIRPEASEFVAAYARVREAGLQLDDLIDQVYNRALVITQRMEPLDHAAIEKLKKEARESGYRHGRADGRTDAAAKLREEVRIALAGIL